uniref:Uncharacterized protein n=1 Tax=Arundo donax TaxID=35708 RepID=A0A0A9DD42_ARUDO
MPCFYQCNGHNEMSWKSVIHSVFFFDFLLIEEKILTAAGHLRSRENVDKQSTSTCQR